MLTLGPIQSVLNDIQVGSAVLNSHQGFAKALFDQYIGETIGSLDQAKATKTLGEIFQNCLQGVTCTYVEMLNKLNLSQVFLWFQEKELMGEASILHNATPGVDFSAIDLVRNLLLSKYMEQPLIV